MLLLNTWNLSRLARRRLWRYKAEEPRSSFEESQRLEVRWKRKSQPRRPGRHGQVRSEKSQKKKNFHRNQEKVSRRRR